MPTLSKIFYSAATLIIVGLISILLLQCNNSGNKPSTIVKIPQKQMHVLAVYKLNGNIRVGDLEMVCSTQGGIDSASKTEKVIGDTIWLKQTPFPVVNANGTPVKKKDGTDSINYQIISIKKDSVNPHVELRDIDSLLKYFKY